MARILFPHILARKIQIEPTTQIESDEMAIVNGQNVYVGKLRPESGGRMRLYRKGRSYLIPADIKPCRIIKK